MAEQSNKTYWPHMILGFIMLAVVLGYWTIRAASSMPVQETNDYMMKYQQSDMQINDILVSKQKFDALYTIELDGVETMVMTDNIHSNRPQPDQVKLASGNNHFSFRVVNKSGKDAQNIKVSFLLTRPHTAVDDQMFEVIEPKEGRYTTPQINITKPGRYTLQLRAVVGDATGYFSREAYLQPAK